MMKIKNYNFSASITKFFGRVIKLPILNFTQCITKKYIFENNAHTNTLIIQKLAHFF